MTPDPLADELMDAARAYRTAFNKGDAYAASAYADTATRILARARAEEADKCASFIKLNTADNYCLWFMEQFEERAAELRKVCVENSGVSAGAI